VTAARPAFNERLKANFTRPRTVFSDARRHDNRSECAGCIALLRGAGGMDTCQDGCPETPGILQHRLIELELLRSV
jgi:hypothetical protein